MWLDAVLTQHPLNSLPALAGGVGGSMNHHSTWSPCGAFVAYTLTTRNPAGILGSSQRATVVIVRPSPIPLLTTSACPRLPCVLHLLPLPHTCVRPSFSPPSSLPLKESGSARPPSILLRPFSISPCSPPASLTHSLSQVFILLPSRLSPFVPGSPAPFAHLGPSWAV